MLFHGLLLSIFLEYVNPASFVPAFGVTKLGTIIPLAVFLGAVIQRGPVSNRQMLAHSNTRWIIFYLLLAFISVVVAEVTFYSWTILKFVLGYVFWFVMFVKLITSYSKLKQVFTVLVLVHVLILILNPALLIEPETRSYVRAGHFLGDGNDFSLSVCIIVPLCLLLYLEAEAKYSKLFYFAALIVLILAIVGTQSRGATLALAGSFAYLWWAGKRKSLGVILISVVVAGIFAFAPPEYLQRMESIANYQEEGSAMGRIMAWKSGIRMALEYPLTGVGTGHFAVALGNEFRPPEYAFQELPWLTAHSMYFLVLGELGFPGLICMMTILLGNFIRLNRLHRETLQAPGSDQVDLARLFLMLNTSLVAFCIGGAFLSVAYYPHIFVLAGLVTAATFTLHPPVESHTMKTGGNESRRKTRSKTAPSRA